MKNILSALIAIILVGFVFFSVLHWLFKWDINRAIGTAIAGAIGGFLAPLIVKSFRKAK